MRDELIRLMRIPVKVNIDSGDRERLFALALMGRVEGLTVKEDRCH